MPTISDALELLTNQHEAIEELYRRLVTAKLEDRAHALGALADTITTHLDAEQELFYPSVLCIDTPATSPGTMAEVTAEHEAIRAALAVLMLTRFDTDAYRAGLADLGELILGHTQWQEDELFVAVSELLPPPMLVGLGTELREWGRGASALAA